MDVGWEKKFFTLAIVSQVIFFKKKLSPTCTYSGVKNAASRNVLLHTK